MERCDEKWTGGVADSGEPCRVHECVEPSGHDSPEHPDYHVCKCGVMLPDSQSLEAFCKD